MNFKILCYALYNLFQRMTLRFGKRGLTIFILIIAINFSTPTNTHAFSLGKPWYEWCAAFCFLPFYVLGESISDSFEKNDALILIVDTETETLTEIDGFPRAIWSSAVIVENKVAIGRSIKDISLLILDADSGKITKKGVSKANWGEDSMAVVGNKVVIGRDGSILIVDTEKKTVAEKGGLPKANWGYESTAVVENKVVMGFYSQNKSISSILIIDTAKGTVSEKGGLSKTQYSHSWGCGSTAAVGSKVVMGGYGSILIVDTKTGIVSEKGGLSKGRWGLGSTAVVGNKVVMGCTQWSQWGSGNSILIIDTVKETVSEKGRLSGSLGFWVSTCTAVVGNKVVMEHVNIHNEDDTAILIVDTEKETVTEKRGFSKGSWDFAAVVGNKVVMGSGAEGASILIVDITKETVTEKRRVFSKAKWDKDSMVAVIGNKVIIRPRRGNSIFIIDAVKETVTEKRGIYEPRAYEDKMITVGNKIVIGGYGAILIIDTAKGTVTEKRGISKAQWGYNNTAVVGNKVVMGSKGNSILIVDTTKGTIIEKGGLPEAHWGFNSTTVVENKVIMGCSGERDNGSSILIIDTEKGTVTEKGGLSEARWGYNSTVVVGNKVIMEGHKKD